jgi:hypothetical protein
MANFAVIKDNKVENVIVADSKTIAEEVTGFTCIQYDTNTETPHIGLGYVDGVFEQPEPVVPTE